MKHTEKFDSLQVFRGLAALGVVLHHSAISTEAFVEKVPDWLYPLFAHGFLGVDFFFVLSGFIIMTSHYNDEKSVASLKSYVIKRFVRIFPPYWPVSISVIIGYFLLPEMSQGPRGEFSLISSLLLLPDSAPPALSVAWTLIHEMMFYIIFCLYFISKRLFIIFVIGWSLAICIMAWLGEGATTSPLMLRLFNPINLEFVLGICVAYLTRSSSNRDGTALAFLGISSIVLLLIWPFALECRILFGLPFSALVLGGVFLERQGKLALPPLMVLMGDASYSIYLIHNPLLSLTSRIVGRSLGFSSWWWGLFAGAVSSVIAGTLYHLFIEKPLIRMFRHRINLMRSA